MSYDMQHIVHATTHYSVVPELDAAIKLVDAALQGSVNADDYSAAFERCLSSSLALATRVELIDGPLLRSIKLLISALHRDINHAVPSSNLRNQLLMLINLHRVAALSTVEGM